MLDTVTQQMPRAGPPRSSGFGNTRVAHLWSVGEPMSEPVNCLIHWFNRWLGRSQLDSDNKGANLIKI
jgi:hypothetical protein